MGLLYFRPYKRLSDSRLLYLITEMSTRLQYGDASSDSIEDNFSQLIREAKKRKLCLSPVELYSKILFSYYED